MANHIINVGFFTMSKYMNFPIESCSKHLYYCKNTTFFTNCNSLPNFVNLLNKIHRAAHKQLLKNMSILVQISFEQG